ncbi:unnamed protein product, partial [Notodromas monacha]
EPKSAHPPYISPSLLQPSSSSSLLRNNLSKRNSTKQQKKKRKEKKEDKEAKANEKHSQDRMRKQEKDRQISSAARIVKTFPFKYAKKFIDMDLKNNSSALNNVMWKILLKIVGIASLCACSPLVKVKTSPHASFSSSSATVYSNGCCGQNGKLLVHKHEHKHKHVHKHLKAVNNKKQIPMKKDHFDFGDFHWQDFDFNDFPFELSSLGHEQKTGKKITPGSKEASSPSVANPWSYRGNNLGWNLGYLGSHSSSSYSSSSFLICKTCENAAYDQLSNRHNSTSRTMSPRCRS